MSTVATPSNTLPWDARKISDATFRTKFTSLPEIIEGWMAEYGGLAGKDIMDFGCGEATTALGIALQYHPNRVVGIDIMPDVERCLPQANAQIGLEHLPGTLRLHQIEPSQLHDSTDRFDLIYSWSVFEHVEQRLLDKTLGMLRDTLNPGGHLFIQIAPLFYSADGSHLMRWIAEPWGHLLNQHSVYMEKLSAASSSPVEYAALQSLFEGLNRLTASQLIEHAQTAGFVVLRDFRTQKAWPIPPQLAEIYQPEVLLNEQVVLLLEPDHKQASATSPVSAAFPETHPPKDTLTGNANETLAEERLDFRLPRFCFATPCHANAMRLRSDGWRYGLGEMEIETIRQKLRDDVRPRWSAEVFPGFQKFNIIELGPQDGFITAGLEAYGVGSIVAIEANVDSFLRCLIFKNALGLRATYFLGDFMAYLNNPAASADLIYASGVMYHLKDPLAFLLRCGEVARHLYLWTFYYDEAVVKAHHYEAQCFVDKKERRLKGEEFDYHKRIYLPETRSTATYSGGIGDFANWMTLPDIERALGLAGFRVDRQIEDNLHDIPAMNIWATRT